MPPSDLRIRPARQEDVAAVSELLVETWHATYDGLLGADKVNEITGSWHSPDALSGQVARPNCAFLVAERDGRIIGHAFVNGEHRPVLFLARLYVRPTDQRRGIGKRLLDAAIACFALAEAVRLEVAAVNRAAVAFYRREGFVRVGDHLELGMRHLRMEKRLQPHT